MSNPITRVLLRVTKNLQSLNFALSVFIVTVIIFCATRANIHFSQDARHLQIAPAEFGGQKFCICSKISLKTKGNNKRSLLRLLVRGLDWYIPFLVTFFCVSSKVIFTKRWFLHYRLLSLSKFCWWIGPIISRKASRKSFCDELIVGLAEISVYIRIDSDRLI